MVKIKNYYIGLIVATLLVSPTLVWACSCAGKPTPTEAFISADAVFVGEVIKSNVSYKDTDILVVKLIKVFKGDITKEVKFTGHSGMCTYLFKEGEQYLVYASKNKDTFRTPSVCSSTQKYSEDSEAIRELEGLQSVVEERMVNGKAVQIVKDYNADGMLLAETPFADNMRNGVYKKYFNDGTIKMEVMYQNGKEILRKDYFENGNLSYQFDHIAMNSKTYYESGNLHFEQMGIDYSASFNRSNEYYESGELKKEDVRNASGKGHIKEYYKSGKLKSESPTERGELSSYGRILTKTYDKDGALLSEKKYEIGDYAREDVVSEIFYDKEKNLKEGTHQEFDENGNLRAEFTLVNGKIEGIGNFYSKKNKQSMTRSYKNGVLDGKTVSYREDGSLIMESYYKGGKPLKYITYDAQGNVLRGYDYLEKKAIIPPKE